MNRVFFRGSIVVLISLSISACTGTLFGGYGDKGLSLEDFTLEVERVFKLQNSMTSELMFMQENGEQPKNPKALMQADQSMQTSCAPLNDYAVLDSEGLSASLSLQRKVEKTVSECEKAANLVKSLLAK